MFAIQIELWCIKHYREQPKGNSMEEKHEFKKVIEEMTPEEVARQQKEIIEMETPAIDILDFLYKDGGTVTYETSELTALCPMTGLPDFYTINIAYGPDKKIPELKSLKLYITFYRNIPILHEHLATKIFDDFNEAVSPKTLKLELIAAVRGGITSSVVKEF